MHRTIAMLAAEIEASVEGATERELTFCPAEGKWCAGQVLEHLQRTYTGTTKGLERVLAEGKPLVTPIAPKVRVMQFMVITASWFPEGRKSPKVAEPKGDVAVMDVPRTIQEKLAEMDGLLDRCQEKFGSGKVLDHPILGALTVDQWRKFHLVHGRHHVKQVRERRALAR